VAVYAVSQLISTELSATATMSKNQRWLMRLLPIGIVFFIFQFPVPAGLVIYWATTNLWTAGQQLVLKRRIEAEIEAKGGSLTGNPKISDDDADSGSDSDAATDADEAEGAPDEAADVVALTGEAAATEDVAVRSKPVPKRRRKGKGQAQAQDEAAGNGAAAAPSTPEPASEPEPAVAEAAADEPKADAAPAQSGGKKKRTPPKRKVSGGPSRPATRKPPKRRK
jgi:YidC/Oxa1 family membrane protein insertase